VTSPADDPHEVVLTVIHPVADYDAWIDHVRSSLPRLAEHGVRRMRVHRAVDDPDEVLVGLDMRTREDAERLMANDDDLQAAMTMAGISMYPAVFIGRVTERFDLDAEALSNGEGQRTIR
jgi:hypothetical protein